MKMKKYLILVVVSFSILIVLLSAQQITGETNLSAKDKEFGSNLTDLQKLELSAKWVPIDKKDVLRGLEGVLVLVEHIEPEIEKYGLTREALQTDTELQLRQYGIKVLTFLEQMSTPGKPWLYIDVNVQMREDLPIAAATIIVRLREDVLLLRGPKRICLIATTWERSAVSSVRLGRIKNIRGGVKDLVNVFINDYLAANPKESPVKEEEKKPKND